VTGTLVYTLGGGWSPIDGFYFAVATLTTSSIADPELVLEDPWLKLFTSFYVLLGIGIVVEVIRRLGISFIEVRRQDAEAMAAKATAGSD
jgi:Ion channel